MENRLDVNLNIEGISKEGSTCLSGSFGNEKHFLEESSLLPSLRLSGYFESIKKSCADSIASPIKSRANSNEKDLLDTITSCPQTLISSRQCKETSSLSPENEHVSELEFNLYYPSDHESWKPTMSEKSAPRVSPICSTISQSTHHTKRNSESLSFDNLSILEKERSNCSSEKSDISHSINHQFSESSEMRPVLSEYENVSPKRKTKPKNQSSFVSSSEMCSVNHDAIDAQRIDELKNNLKLEENALIQHLTDQIITLNQWRETAILEAVEKDRRLTDLQEQLTELQQEFDVSKEECSGHHKVIQELKLNLEEAQYEVQYLEELLTKQSQPDISPVHSHIRQDEYLQPFDTSQQSNYLSPSKNRNTSLRPANAQKYQHRFRNNSSVRPRTTTPRMYSNYQPYIFSTNSISSNEQECSFEDAEDPTTAVLSEYLNQTPVLNDRSSRTKTISRPGGWEMRNECFQDNASKVFSSENEWTPNHHIYHPETENDNLRYIDIDKIRYIDEIAPKNKSLSGSPPPLSSIEIREKPDPINYIDDSSNTQIYSPDVKFEENQERKYISRLFQKGNT